MKKSRMGVSEVERGECVTILNACSGGSSVSNLEREERREEGCVANRKV